MWVDKVHEDRLHWHQSHLAEPPINSILIIEHKTICIIKRLKLCKSAAISADLLL